MLSQPISILAIGYHQPIMEVVHRLINSHGNWQGDLALSLDAARTKLAKGVYDAVLLCVGVSSEDEAILTQIMKTSLPKARMIRHFGGGSGLLESEIRKTMEQQPFK